MKKCTKCHEGKSLTEYGKAKRTSDGLNYWCKACVRDAGSKYYAANPEKAREAVAKYRAANQAKIQAYRAIYRHENADKNRASASRWASENSEAVRIHSHNYRARKRNNGGRLSKDIAERLYTLQRGKCACGCKQPLGDDYHLDHIMPLALGGSNTDDNIQLLRARCNNHKHAKHPVDFMQQRGFLL